MHQVRMAVVAHRDNFAPTNATAETSIMYMFVILYFIISLSLLSYFINSTVECRHFCYLYLISYIVDKYVELLMGNLGKLA